MRAFENWIEDESNQDVVFVIKECIENPGMLPLFISGPPKVGKSYLASAMEQEYIKRYGFTTKRMNSKAFYREWILY